MRPDGLYLLGEAAAEDFWRLRLELFRELGEVSQTQDTGELENATKRYYLAHIHRDLFTWGIFRQGSLVAAGSLCLFSRLPYLQDLNGSEGYILNIYTRKPFRGRGFASQILEAILAFSRENHIGRLWLHASAQGARLYTQKGFVPKGQEMELFLP